MATMFNKGCSVLMFLLLAVLQAVGASSVFAQDSLCAEVKIEIRQKLSLERQAFDAHMRITNGLDTSAIENVGAVLHFEDDKGNVVIATSDPNNTSASFFARIDSLSGINAIDGSGQVNPKTTADIHWLIIPAQGTGGTEPGGKLYYIGATLTYTLLGQQSSVEVTPDFVTVKPQPLLDLDYFLAGDVYADDAFTPETEPPIPFTLGVRINNVGAGPANKVTIESAQPKIVENSLGLLIDFKIIDSYVSDQPAGKTLLIDFGDIEPGASKVGRWNMVTTLSGKFVDISASYTHADSLGGALTSLIRNLNSYLLVRDVKVDLPGRDNIRDFLAKSGDVLRVYESDGGDFPVTDQSGRATLQSSGSFYQFNFPATTGFAYAKVSDPFAGKRTPNNVKRSDGKTISPENVWLSQTRDENNNWQYFINIFDANTTGLYTFDFVSGTTSDIAGVVYHDANSNGQKDEDEAGMGNIKVMLQGSDNEGAGVSVVAYTTVDGAYKFVSLKPGTYRLKVDDVDGYINGVRGIGGAGGVLSVDEDNLITDIVLTAGANVSGYVFAKRKPAALTDEADLAIAMTADKTLVRTDDTIIFSLIASNAGPAAATGVTITDKLPQGLILVSAAASTGNYDTASGVWTIDALNKGATATLTLTAKVGTISEPVTNMATIASALLDPNPANNAAQVTLMPEENDASFSLSLRIAEEARILALVSCPDVMGEDDAACAESKAEWATAYFASLGYSALAVTTTEAFRTQLRAGKHNVYWINGGSSKLAAPLADEIRMAVQRGDALIVDGARDAQSVVFDNVLGATLGASPDNSGIVIDGTVVAIAGEAKTLTLNGATALVRFNDDANSVAVARHAYGQGAALSAGFDLIGSLRMPTSESAMRAFLVETLGVLTPEGSETLVSNAYLPLVVDVTHSDKSATIANVSIALPTGVKFIDASPAPSTATSDRITWALALTAEDMQSLRLGVRVPTDNTTLRLTASVAETAPEVAADLDIDVIHFDATRMSGMVAQISDSTAKEAAQTAQVAFAAADYTAAIAELVRADQALPESATSALRLNLARWLQEAELLWQENPITPTVPANIVAISGTPQVTTIHTAFAQILQAKVLDSSNNPVPEVMVTFSLPENGASGTFIGGGTSATAATDAQGLVAAPAIIANGIAGSYTVIATAQGVTQPANFALTNQNAAPVATSITAVGGTPQSTAVNTAFEQSLQAVVLDASNQPMQNVAVTFTLPISGASATFAGGGTTAVATTNAQGIATSPSLMANNITGSYQARASAVGVTEQALFDLSNETVTQVPTIISATSGTPQSTVVDTAFAQTLQASVRDISDQPIAGVMVTFTLPVSGASAVFAGGDVTAVAETNAQGVATSPILTANNITGSYQAQASVVGVTEKALFDLTNTVASGGNDEPASIVALSDAAQVATVNAVFAHPLRARVLAADHQPIAGALVTFTLPASGASAVFANGQKSVAVVTDMQGVATSPTFSANATAGHHTATATVDGVAATATFALINSAIPDGSHSVATDLLVVNGSSQIAVINTTFAQALQVIALDAENRPVPDLEVTFTLPAGGASARFPDDAFNVAVKTDAQGMAISPTLIANAVAGDFAATATAGALQAEFMLTNREMQKMPNRVVAVAGTPQTTMINTAFGETLNALVLDADQQPLSGIAVTFSLPALGASAAFSGNTSTVIAVTDEDGLAVTPALVANGNIGDYHVVAKVEGVAQNAVFALTNSTAPVIIGDIPASIVAVSGAPQTTAVGAAFAQTLHAKVLDAGNQPVANVAVTFTLPTAGASAAFIGIIGNTVTVTTNASGTAVSPTLVANATMGSYTVTAQAEGVATIADFSLTNEAVAITPVVGSVVAESGTPQLTQVNMAFTAPLKVLVKDTGDTPMSDVAVTFILPASGASALFDNGRNTLTVLTDENGIASSRTLVANGLMGSYSVIASVEGVAATAHFDLTNETATVTPVAGSIVVESGAPQSTETNAAFAAPLEALVKDTNGAPMAGVEITFALPVSGASATFTGGGTTAMAMTNAQGVATSPILIANNTVGSYQAQASVAGVTERAFFNLSNTATSSHTAPTFNGTTATGSGTISASITGGGSNCAFDLDRTRTSIPSGLMMNLLGKYLMPHGAFEFVLVDCDVGSTVTITTTWPNLKGVTGYMKYGPTPWLPWVSTWYVPNNLKINGNSVSYTVADGGLGDDDLTENGVIRDPGGPIVALSGSITESIPVLGRPMQALLLLLMILVAAFGYRRARRS